ncbi:hypothetical protein CcarbDRAFT_5003 [Clostridium carboxidivorans P7]|uniref:Uncharacterized protein n=1 Tax=Clostridium carboxidivorans P7 TaxID=536227 RepID=C6Q1T5_9CLOT|nr:hypothetical protein [Clostridium carboxidivorans]EET84552.1 hypothetical protein CcarbDRAFT_5003 [Clostridium carboxidivorans P7]EFG89852.1 hypothetical protein CLCAR_0045 [Clostridium carboxidivorans P7]
MEKIELTKKIVIIPQESAGISLGTCSVEPGTWCAPDPDPGAGCMGFNCN